MLMVMKASHLLLKSKEIQISQSSELATSSLRSEEDQENTKLLILMEEKLFLLELETQHNQSHQISLQDYKMVFPNLEKKNPTQAMELSKESKISDLESQRNSTTASSALTKSLSQMAPNVIFQDFNKCGAQEFQALYKIHPTQST